MTRKGVTLTRFISADPSGPFPGGLTPDELAGLMEPICAAARGIAQATAGLGLGELGGETGGTNVQGERVKRLDRFGNEAFLEAFRKSELVCTIVSEEMDKPAHVSDQCGPGSYALLVDPVDGSSNVDLNIDIGTIFSFVRLNGGAQGHARPDSVLQAGRNQVVAGYVLYGPSTILVFTAGRGVHGFTLDPASGEFMLSHENLKMPPRGRTYSVNEGNSARWDPGVRAYLAHLKEEDGATGRPYSHRYVGALVADFHRGLLIGGIYLYPGETGKPEGKLRLAYECAPLAMLAEAAGGRATTGSRPILDLAPKDFHDRSPLAIGSVEDVEDFERFLFRSSNLSK